jgi:opacity protein-like surface antigen
MRLLGEGTVQPIIDATIARRPRLRPAAAALALLLLSLAAGTVHGETLLTGFGGVAFGGATDRTRGSYGGALGFLGAGVLGFEVEFCTTPEFFGNARQDVFSDNNVLTLMGSVLLAAPSGPVRIYGAAGAGLLKTRLEDPDRLFSIDSNDFGINVGGGLLAYLGDHVGLRADARYFRDLQDAVPDGEFDIDLGEVDYWRVVGGITLKF